METWNCFVTELCVHSVHEGASLDGKFGGLS